MLRLPILAGLITLLAACAVTHPNVAPPTCFHRNAAVETDIGYCQALRSGNRLIVSGSVGQGDMPDAMHKAYDTIRQTLAAHRLEFRHVVKESVYTTDLDAFIRSKDIRKEYYGSDFPAATWVQVQRLYLPAFVVEVEVEAEFPR